MYPLCDADCTFTFTHAEVILRDARGIPVLTGWRENSGPRLWRIALQPDEENLPRIPNTAQRTTLEVYSAYELPSIEALIRYFHAVAGYPVRSTWLTSVRAGNYSYWPGLTLANTAKYFPSARATIMGHLFQNPRDKFTCSKTPSSPIKRAAPPSYTHN